MPNDTVAEALYSATTVEPRGVIPVNRADRTLGDWHTVNANRKKSVTTFTRQLLAFLREIPDDMTIPELIDAVEEAEVGP